MPPTWWLNLFWPIIKAMPTTAVGLGLILIWDWHGNDSESGPSSLFSAATGIYFGLLTILLLYSLAYAWGKWKDGRRATK